MKKKEKLALIHQYYPGATTTIDNVNHIIDFVENELDLEPNHVMFADSICSDDVNSIQYPSRAVDFLGPFKLGGLNGFPFTGLTGMSAFASHVPDDGAVFIYYGPHIGVSKEGNLGQIHRYGQSIYTSCCGAANGALDKLQKGNIIEGNKTDLDYQMNTIEQILYKNKDTILNAELPLFEATETIYQAIDERINYLIAHTKYNCRYIILVGAILINGDSDIGSFTQTKRFDVINLSNNERISYLNKYQL